MDSQTTPTLPTRGEEPRRVSIGDKERGAYSSDRPRSGAPAAPRGPREQRNCRVLTPGEDLAYPRCCLVLIVGPAGVGKDAWAKRLFPEGTVFSADEIRERIGDKAEDPAATAITLVKNVVTKRLEQNRLVVVTATAMAPEERTEFVLVAQAARRSTHLVLLDANREAANEELVTRGVEVSGEVLDAQFTGLAATRKLIMSGELGREGFSSAIMLTQSVAAKVKSIHLGRIDVSRS